MGAIKSINQVLKQLVVVLLAAGVLCSLAENSSFSSETADDDIAEIVKHREAMARQVEPLNRMNPLSARAESTSTSSLPTPLVWVTKAMEDPQLRRVLAVVDAPEVANSLKEMAANPQQQNGWIAQGVFFIAVVIARWRVLLRPRSFFSRLFIKFGFFIAFVSGTLAIAFVVYGQPLVRIISAFAQAF